MIKEIHCPICNASVTADETEMNAYVLAHHKDKHPETAKKISDTIMEIGKMHDKIKRIKKDLKRVTGYRIPSIEAVAMTAEERQKAETDDDIAAKNGQC